MAQRAKAITSESLAREEPANLTDIGEDKAGRRTRRSATRAGHARQAGPFLVMMSPPIANVARTALTDSPLEPGAPVAAAAVAADAHGARAEAPNDVHADRTASVADMDVVEAHSTPIAATVAMGRDAMDAALALTDLFTSPAAMDRATPAEAPEPRACELVAVPDQTPSWPFCEGKGCFGKAHDGKDLPFLERLFLVLSFPSLALPGQHGKTVGDAIRWKAKATRSTMSFALPADAAAFEIADVALLEASVYPQYASGEPPRRPPIFGSRDTHPIPCLAAAMPTRARDASAGRPTGPWPCAGLGRPGPHRGCQIWASPGQIWASRLPNMGLARPGPHRGCQIWASRPAASACRPGWTAHLRSPAP